MPTKKQPVKKQAPTSKKTTGKKAAKSAQPIRFTAKLLSPAPSERTSGSWSFLRLPMQASKKLPSRSMCTVDGALNGAAFQATLEPDGNGGHWLKVERALREAAGAAPGDVVTLVVTPVAQEPEPHVPPDLKKALAAADPEARATWSDITPTARRDWIYWIVSGKRAETRALRIDKACDMLAKGKRRACCFDRSGMYDKSLSCPAAQDE